MQTVKPAERWPRVGYAHWAVSLGPEPAVGLRYDLVLALDSPDGADSRVVPSQLRIGPAGPPVGGESPRSSPPTL